MLKIIRFVLLILAWSLVFLLTIIFSLVFVRQPNNVYRMSQLMWPLGLKILGLEIEGIHKERLLEQPAIIVSNHQNNLDLLVGSWSCPPRCVTLGKKSLLWIPIFGQMYWLTGNLLIDRDNKKKAWQALDKVAEEIHRKKISVWIMPEGTRSRGRGLLPFKKGAFVTAIKAQVPIIPVVFSPYHQVFDFNRKRPGKIIVSVLPPVSTKGLSVEEASALSETIYQQMHQELTRLSQLT